MIPDASAEVEKLLRILRRYANSTTGTELAAAFAELAEGEQQGLVAFDEGSTERIVESVLAAAHRQMALIVGDMRLEIGWTVLDGLKWLDDVDPEDFGRPS